MFPGFCETLGSHLGRWLQVLVDKCLGRRVCMHCKRNYNVAEINIPAQGGRPGISLPPLSPPPECEAHLVQRQDDKLETVLHRLQVCCCSLPCPGLAYGSLPGPGVTRKAALPCPGAVRYCAI